MSFSLSLKTKDINFTCSSMDRALPSKTADRKKKSPSQKKRDFLRRKTFLETKLAISNLNKDSSDITPVPAVKQFKCDQCDYTSKTSKGLNVHIRRMHQIVQLDGLPDNLENPDHHGTETNPTPEAPDTTEDTPEESTNEKMEKIMDAIKDIKSDSKSHSDLICNKISKIM